MTAELASKVGEDEVAGKMASLRAMFNPESIAVIGATDKPGYGGGFLNNLLSTGSSARLHLINPNREEVHGLPCLHSVADLPEAVDLAAIIVPAALVVDAFRRCIERGARSALIVSAGFAELGTEAGRSAQAELRRLARESGVHLCGPNCLGFANVAGNSWTTPSSRIAPDMQSADSAIALVSQSGATAYRSLLSMARDRGIAFRYIVSTGNEADLESSDFIEFMVRDPKVKVVAAVIEGFKDGERFKEVAELAAEAGKPIVALKIGRTEVGARAASSHTASMTGSDVVQDALFRQKAVVRVEDYDELLETANMFAKVGAVAGGRVGVISESGGMASLMADKCAELGLDVPPLAESTRQSMLEIMGGSGSAANPADLTRFGSGVEFPRILDLFLGEAAYDFLIMLSVGGEVQAHSVAAASRVSGKPILFVWTDQVSEQPGLSELRSSNAPVFHLPGKAALASRRLVDYHRRRQNLLAERKNPLAISRPPEAAFAALHSIARASDGSTLNEHDSKSVLTRMGVAIPQETMCADLDACAKAAEAIGYPVVMKLISSQLVHKTEAGGVRIGIRDRPELEAAHAQMHESVRQHAAGVLIEGVLVQEMAPDGIDVILGISRDPHFGPVLMLGLGGIFAEALKTASWRVCPIPEREAGDMIEEAGGLARLLSGCRGNPPADRKALIEAMVELSRFAVHSGGMVAEIDINPMRVLAAGKGTKALDASIILNG